MFSEESHGKSMYTQCSFTIHTTTCTITINTYHHYSCEFEPHSWRGVLDTTLCDNVCQWLATDWWFSPGTPVSSTNKTDCHDITDILLKVVYIIINQTKPNQSPFIVMWFLKEEEALNEAVIIVRLLHVYDVIVVVCTMIYKNVAKKLLSWD